MNTMVQNRTDVVIVGAGPTGLTLACELLRRGIRCRIIDKAATPSITSRALGVQPRTMELFEMMGVVDDICDHGGPVLGARLYDGDRLLLTIGGAEVQRIADRPDVPYPNVWIIPQSDVEGILLGLLQRLGSAVERSTELIAFRQDREGVVATVQTSTGVGELHATWLVGCDGAHSRVRKALGVAFEGNTYDEQFVLADVDLDWQRDRDATHNWFHRDGMLSIFPFPGSDHLWRIFAEISVRPGEQAPPASLELFQRLLRERTGDTLTRISNPVWISNFKINRRMVDRYRVGRVFLAGDAAHIHSPFGGQGMNTGIQDAFNLAWKLALVIEAKTPVALLDTYQEERLPVAKRVLRDTDRNTKLILARNPLAKFVREHVLARPQVQAYLVRRGSQLNVHYRASSLTRTYHAAQDIGGWRAFRSAPHAGDRAPQAFGQAISSRSKLSLFDILREPTWHLLLFAGNRQDIDSNTQLVRLGRRVDALFGDTIRMHLIVAARDTLETSTWPGHVVLDAQREWHMRYGAGRQALYLIRPDGYIAFRSQPANERQVLEYLRQTLRLTFNQQADRHFTCDCTIMP